MFKLAARIPVYVLSRSLNYPLILPSSLTLSVTYRCNSRCKTCNITQRTCRELTHEEWASVFRNYRSPLAWATFSGGEPFLRHDLAAIANSLYTRCKPSVINFPTNGILTDRIIETIREIATSCRQAHLVVNVSIDDLDERHDSIRGSAGSYKKACETIEALRACGLKNLSVGIHTVISRYNVDRIPEIYGRLKQLHPDSLIAEIAEQRVELQTIGCDISPEIGDYKKAAEFLLDKEQAAGMKGAGKLTRALRLQYHRLAMQTLHERRQVIPCYAGITSAQIAPDGDVWFCCIKADPVGNLRTAGYDFRKIWNSPKARSLRKSIKNRECFCPLANATYTNMLHHVPGVTKVMWNYIRQS